MADIVRSPVDQDRLQEGMIPLDHDVLEGFQQMGDASAQKMNVVLREYVKAQRKNI